MLYSTRSSTVDELNAIKTTTAIFDEVPKFVLLNLYFPNWFGPSTLQEQVSIVSHGHGMSDTK